MFIAPPRGSSELELYIQWLNQHGLKYTVLTPEVTTINQPLLLCGGADIGVNKRRDRLEFNWIRSALENGQPIFGVCRGMQILNVYFGGMVNSLNEKVEESHRLDSFEDDMDHGKRISQFHEVEDLDGNKLMVNSRHHQYCSTVANNFKVTYKSIDGGMIPEAFEDRKRMIYAVQWHPERFESDNNMIPLNFLNETKRNI